MIPFSHRCHLYIKTNERRTIGSVATRLMDGGQKKSTVAKAIEVRGLKVTVTKVPIPVDFGAAFEGERVRGEDIYLECGGGRTQMVEWVTSKRMDEVTDGKIEVIGPDFSQVPAQGSAPDPRRPREDDTGRRR